MWVGCWNAKAMGQKNKMCAFECQGYNLTLHTAALKLKTGKYGIKTLLSCAQLVIPRQQPSGMFRPVLQELPEYCAPHQYLS